MSVSNLPEGWVVVSTQSVFSQIPTTDKKIQTKSCLPFGRFPVIDQGQQEVSGFCDDEAKVISNEKPIVIFGDHTRVIKWVQKDFVPGADGTKVLVANDEVEPKYFFYQLRSIELPDKGYARHFKFLNESEFVVAPLAEQQQIAQKLDELLAQVDTLKTRLDAIPKILKRFRQSVLAAAVSGRLTEEWRGIQIEKLDKWRWVTLGEIANVKGGITKDSKKQESSFVELPYLRVANVQRYYLDLTEIKTIRIPESRVKDLLLENGDILFNEGGDLDKLGRGWIWEGQIQKCSYQNHVFRARLKNKLDSSKYISWWGNTEGFEYFIRNGKQTTNLASINKTLLSNLPINLPPSKEQTEIVRRVEQLFAYAEQIEQRVKDAQTRVNHLTQSILAKAFRGELTAEWRAQNPDLISGENSAAALLERIKAERKATAKPKKKVRP